MLEEANQQQVNTGNDAPAKLSNANTAKMDDAHSFFSRIAWQQYRETSTAKQV